MHEKYKILDSQPFHDFIGTKAHIRRYTEVKTGTEGFILALDQASYPIWLARSGDATAPEML